MLSLIHSNILTRSSFDREVRVNEIFTTFYEIYLQEKNANGTQTLRCMTVSAEKVTTLCYMILR